MKAKLYTLGIETEVMPFHLLEGRKYPSDHGCGTSLSLHGCVKTLYEQKQVMTDCTYLVTSFGSQRLLTVQYSLGELFISIVLGARSEAI